MFHALADGARAGHDETMASQASPSRTAGRFDTVESVIDSIRRGRMVIVADEMDRENEGDLIMAAEKVTPAAINFMAQHGRGLICVPATPERLRELGITRMVAQNQESHKTDFMVSVDARQGITTGISAHDRARTIRVMADPASRPADLVQPGHVFPLQAKAGGILHRTGHTEAAVDITRLAGLAPVAVICEILNKDGTMARLPQLQQFRRRHKLKICRVRDLIAYRHVREKLVERVEAAELPTPFGRFRLHVYRCILDNRQHFALVLGGLHPDRAILTRVHAECVAADVFHSNLFGSDRLLSDSLRAIAREGGGVLLYMRHDGWGPTMVDAQGRMKAPHLREYGLGAQILADLGIKKIRLLTNHPKTMVGLDGFGLKIVEQIPLSRKPRSKP